MEVFRRLSRTIKPQLVLYVVAIIAVLFVVNSRLFQDTVFNFLLGGMLPGTDFIVQPFVVMLIAVIVLGLILVVPCVLLLIRHILIAQATRRMVAADSDSSVMLTDEPANVLVSDMTDHKIAAHAALESVKEVTIHLREVQTVAQKVVAAVDKPVITKTKPTRVSNLPIEKKPWFMPLIRKAQAFILDFMRITVVGIRQICYIVSRGLRRGFNRLQLGLLKVVIFSIKSAHAFGRFVRHAARAAILAVKLAATVSYAVAVWLVFFVAMIAILIAGVFVDTARRLGNWVKPYMFRLDSWLELRYRSLIKNAGLFLNKFEAYQVTVSALRDSSAAVRRFFKSLSE